MNCPKCKDLDEVKAYIQNKKAFISDMDGVIYHGNMSGKKESICIEEISYPPVPHRPPAFFEI